VLAEGCSVEVEFWETTPDGDLTSPRRNPYADRMPAGQETVDNFNEALIGRHAEPESVRIADEENLHGKLASVAKAGGAG